MRSARVKDYWRKYSKINHKIEIKEIDLKGINGIEVLNAQKGIFAICGLNGVGKSTIISAIKSILGLDLNVKDELRISKEVEGLVTLGQEKEINITSEYGKRLIDVIPKEANEYLYLEHEQAIDVINRITEETNFDEFLEQYDEYSMSKVQLEEISYIIGKDYKEVYITEIEDDFFKFPFFRVNCNGVRYDSTKMGVGEHILFYYYIMIEKIEKDGIVIIEEPESCISVRSQEKFMDFMAKKNSEQKIQLIVTTHSPFIIKNIPSSNIILVDRYEECSIIYTGEEKRLTKELGLDINKRGIIYVEDNLAELFLKKILNDSNNGFILEDYDIKSVNGESEITSRLKSNCTEIDFKIIGIYDGDMREKLSLKVKRELKWKYMFLPSKEELEVEFRRCVKDKRDIFISTLKKDKREVLSALSSVEGDNYHDWFINLHNKLRLTSEDLFNILYNLWIGYEENISLVNEFIIELKEVS
ncbi:AAA family ATPase [uncultured Clostridium sp.]|uniref:ATP-dependent nuclease n=1 Tax=uncultured Clostridium sp. TaxID=59620 RepID=UPI0025D68C26|nr:AAA family ATPase [uncultured Clostridium sp.]